MMKKTLLNYAKQITFKIMLFVTFISSYNNTLAQCDNPMNIGVIPDATGECSISVSAPEREDDCDGTIIGTTFDPTYYDVVGTYTINWTFTDNDWNTYTGTQTVIVTDNAAPMLDVFPDLTDECEVYATSVSLFDECAGLIYGTTSDPLYYDVQGNYTINWTFNDGHGNSVTLQQNVVLNDVTDPIPDETSLTTFYNPCSITLGAIPTATDNCAGAIIGTTSDPLTYNTVGIHTITWYFEDANGNSVSQNQNLVVTDGNAPVVDIATLPDVTGVCTATVTSTPTATDNCIGLVTGTTSDPLTYTVPGSYVITWTYTDGNNTTTQTQNVILDTINTDTYLNGYGTTINSYQTTSGTTYQWLDCNNGNAIISGEIGPNYTPLNSGSYAVEITVGSCLDTTECVNFIGVGIKESTNNTISIYPNPTNGMVNVNLGSTNGLVNYSISTVEGRMIIEGKTTENTFKYNLQNESNGVYFLKINGNNLNKTYKVIKQ